MRQIGIVCFLLVDFFHLLLLVFIFYVRGSSQMLTTFHCFFICKNKRLKSCLKSLSVGVGHVDCEFHCSVTRLFSCRTFYQCVYSTWAGQIPQKSLPTF